MWLRRLSCRWWYVLCAGAAVACDSDDPPAVQGDGPEPPMAALPSIPALPNPDSPARPSADQCAAEVQPGRAGARLLTRLQYDNTVRDLVGDESNPATAFPRENTFLGFGNNIDAHTASLVLVEQQVQAAERIAAAFVAKGLDDALPCAAGDRSEACAAAFIGEFASRAFRRPVSDAERQPLLEIFTQANASWGFEKGIELVVASVLQSPQLLYRVETESGTRVSDKVVALDGYQVATRLSYFLWNTMPDEELMALAANDGLREPSTIQEQAWRMVEDPRARGTIQDFNEQWLGLSRFAEIVREADGVGQTGASVAELNASWHRSVQAFVQDAYYEGGGTLDALLSSRTVFVDATLGALYGLDASGAAEGELTSVVDEQRAGILTQPAMMALLAHSNQSAPVQRGLFVREQLLCHELPPPPPDVDTTPPDPDPNATTRERFRQHSANERCATCHQLLDPVGFGLENFDQLGRYRSDENGMPIDASGNLLIMDNNELEGPFNGALELADKLSQSGQVRDCLATQWFRYGMGRAETRDDTCSLDEAKLAFETSGGDFKTLLVALTGTDGFRYRASHEQDP
jgi:hypothetical protein